MALPVLVIANLTKSLFGSVMFDQLPMLLTASLHLSNIS